MNTESRRRIAAVMAGLLTIWLVNARPDGGAVAHVHVARVQGAPMVFFRTANATTTKLLRRVVRVNPRTGKSLPAAIPPSDFRSFVDADQVGATSFVVWTTKRGELWLGAAGPTGRFVKKWRVGRADGFEARPVPLDEAAGTGTGFVRVSDDVRTALLVNGRGRRRIGRYVDLRSGEVRIRQLPEAVSHGVVDAASAGGRFALVGETGAIVTVGPRGDVVAQAKSNALEESRRSARSPSLACPGIALCSRSSTRGNQVASAASWPATTSGQAL